jgi:prevent-host-death family protein
MKTWQLQEAKAKLSELLRQAEKTGPQCITVRGENTAIILSNKDYEKLLGEKENLWEFLQASPLKGIDLNIERDKSLSRNVDF